MTYREFGQSGLVRRHLAVAAGAMFSIGNPRVRSVGTMVGAMAAATPDTDLAMLLGIQDADVVVLTAGGESRRPALSWLDPVADGELLTGISVPLREGSQSVYRRFPRIGQPIAAVAARADVDSESFDVLIGCLGVAPVWIAIPRVVVDKGAIDRAVVDRLFWTAVAARTAAVATLDASADYRAHLAGVLVARAVAELANLASPAAAGSTEVFPA